MEPTMRFEFASATRIIFGAGALREIGAIAKAFGTRSLVVTGKSTNRAQPLLGMLESAGLFPLVFPIEGEPAIDSVVRGVQSARENQCDLVIGFGGGSPIDAGKAIAALMTNDGDVFDYLEVIGRGKTLINPPVPFVAIPTTAGTGAEATRNAVLASPEHRVKVSLRSPLMLPKVALMDPELTYDLPPAITATTGLDALTQLIEPYVSCRANPLTDSICAEGIRRAARSLRHAFDNGADKAAREDMALASLFGGLALANAGLGAVHGFAAPIGGMFSAPHGAVCAALLPHVMEANLIALHERAPRAGAVRRYDEVARLLTGSERAGAAEGIAWIGHLCGHLQIQPLRRHGIAAGDFSALIEKAANASSMKANPIELTALEMREILERAL
jgi:alcohol dehydrogenase class IV